MPAGYSCPRRRPGSRLHHVVDPFCSDHSVVAANARLVHVTRCITVSRDRCEVGVKALRVEGVDAGRSLRIGTLAAVIAFRETKSLKQIRVDVRSMTRKHVWHQVERPFSALRGETPDS